MLAPINIAARFGAHPDLDKVDVHVRQVMPKGLDELAVKRRFPIIVGGSILATLASWALGASSR